MAGLQVNDHDSAKKKKNQEFMQMNFDFFTKMGDSAKQISKFILDGVKLFAPQTGLQVENVKKTLDDMTGELSKITEQITGGIMRGNPDNAFDPLYAVYDEETETWRDGRLPKVKKSDLVQDDELQSYVQPNQSQNIQRQFTYNKADLGNNVQFSATM